MNNIRGEEINTLINITLHSPPALQCYNIGNTGKTLTQPNHHATTLTAHVCNSITSPSFMNSQPQPPPDHQPT